MLHSLVKLPSHNNKMVFAPNNTIINIFRCIRDNNVTLVYRLSDFDVKLLQ